MDPRFTYEDPLQWRAGTKQVIHGYDYEELQPTKPVDDIVKQVEFELLGGNNPIMLGNNTRFCIEGRFERKAVRGAANEQGVLPPEPEWQAVPLADRANVMLAPNWFELMLQSFEMYHGNSVIKTHDEANYIPWLLNTYLYSRMDPTIKKFLCPEACSPGNGVPSLTTRWEFGSAEWQAYAAHVFTDENIRFTYVPLFQFPWYQAPNWLMDARVPKALPPIRNLGKLISRMTLRDDLDIVWRKRAAANNTHSYRFKFVSVKLDLEEARLNPAYEKQLFSPMGKSKLLYYPGVTKLMKCETINNAVFFHNIKFESVTFPEGIFIFAVPKKLIASIYKYGDHVADASLFMPHNIEQVTVEYDGEPLTIKPPHIGDLKDKQILLKNYMDHLTHPPFGIDIDASKLLRSDLANSFGDTNFPSVYLNLCTEGRERLIPHQNTGQALAKDCDLNIGLKFTGTGATPDSTYIAYVFYTDVSCVLDQRTRKFSSYYNLK